jgi:sugar lactone lactonase YvrE
VSQLIQKVPTLALALFLGYALAGCQPSALIGSGHLRLPDQTDAQAVVSVDDQDSFPVPPLTGQLEGFAPARAVAATVGELASKATIAMVDTVTGQTIASTVSSTTGTYRLVFSNTFKPLADRVYHLEAFKGLPMGGSSNRVGTPVGRIRNIVFWKSGGWVSLSNSVPTSTSLGIGRATTAISVIASLRRQSTQEQAGLVGKLSGTSFSATGTGISSGEYSAVLALVTDALSADQDPVAAIAYNPLGATPEQKYARKPRAFVFSGTFSTSSGSGKAVPGGTVTFNGLNFPDPTSVSIGGLPAAGWSVDPKRTQLAVTLPPNAYSGIVQVTVGSITWSGPFIPVRGTVGTLVGNGYPGFEDGVGLEARMSEPLGITVDSSGSVFVADTFHQRIRKVLPNALMTSLAGTGVRGFSDAFMPVLAQFDHPRAVAVDGSGNLFVTDSGNHRIRKISPKGFVTTLAGSGTIGQADGMGTSAQFNAPFGVAVDRNGFVYVADRDNHRVRKISPSGMVTTLAGNGSPGSIDGLGKNAQFNLPVGIAVDQSGNVYVGGNFDYKIRKVTPNGMVTTLAGSGAPGFGDGSGDATQFNQPYGVAVDISGNVYVADRANHRIRKVTPAGQVTTLAGSGSPGFADGGGATAQFNHPSSIALDDQGNVYIGDANNHRIRVYTP